MVLLGVIGLGLVIGLAARGYRLGFPNKQVFDEVYFPVFAQHYIDGVSFYDVHPPFGKFVIAIGMLIWGDNPIGWRLMPFIFGIGIIALMPTLWWAFFKDKIGAWIIAFLVAIDGIFIVYSRTGLMDGVLFFFTFITLLAALRTETWVRLFWLGTLLGLSVAIKWPSLALLIPVAFLMGRQKKHLKFWEMVFPIIWAAVVYVVIVWIGQLLIHTPNAFVASVNWNFDAESYHAHLTATHPWGSPWWSWPLMLKPVLFIYDTVGNKIQAENNMGNPLIWISSTFAVLGTVFYLIEEWFKKRRFPVDHPLVPFLLGYFAFWLPWAPIHRVLFLYHYLPAYGFALCILTYWLVQLWKRKPGLVVLALVLFLAVSIFEMPLSVGWISLTKEQVDLRTFFVNSKI